MPKLDVRVVAKNSITVQASRSNAGSRRERGPHAARGPKMLMEKERVSRARTCKYSGGE